MDSEGRTIGITDAHRDDGKRFIVHVDEKADCVYGTAKRDTCVCSQFDLVTVASCRLQLDYLLMTGCYWDSLPQVGI